MMSKPLTVRDVHEASLLQMIEDRDSEIASLQSQLAECREREGQMREAVKEYREANSDLWIATGEHQKVLVRRCNLLWGKITPLAIKLFSPEENHEAI